MTVVTLPKSPRPNRMNPDLLDFGITQRGAASLRVNRPGSRYRMTFIWPAEVMEPNVVARFLSRLKRGKRRGVQIDILLPQLQGSPGAPVVDGAGQEGSSIAVRGFTPGYAFGDDFYLTIVEADGTAYLHSVAESGRADATGDATIEIEPPLRAPFPDGAVIEMARPYIQGELIGESFSYAHESQRRVPLTITIEEYQ